MYIQFPEAINIFTDGAMDYDPGQTGGTGFVIKFPESSGIPDIEESFRRDSQGIHRLEMIAILEAMQELHKWLKKNSVPSMGTSRITVHTDRHSLSDSELLDPWKIADWKKNGWKNHEEKPIKDADLLDQIQKVRRKLSDAIRGKVEIKYIRRRKNKKADSLSKKGKREGGKNRKIIREPQQKLSKRLFDGDEIDYRALKARDQLVFRVYKKNPVRDEYEVIGEISGENHHGKTVRIYVSLADELEIHRHHFYKAVIDRVYKHHIRVSSISEEVDCE